MCIYMYANTIIIMIVFRYVDDIPSIDGEAYAGLVMSECAHARFKVDASGLKEIEVCDTFMSPITCICTCCTCISDKIYFYFRTYLVLCQ